MALIIRNDDSHYDMHVTEVSTSGVPTRVWALTGTDSVKDYWADLHKFRDGTHLAEPEYPQVHDTLALVRSHLLRFESEGSGTGSLSERLISLKQAHEYTFQNIIYYQGCYNHDVPVVNRTVNLRNLSASAQSHAGLQFDQSMRGSSVFSFFLL